MPPIAGRASTLALLLLIGCGRGEACTTIEALPVVSVDLEALAPALDPATLVVCLDDECVTPGAEGDPLVFPEETQARFALDDDRMERTILVRTGAGEEVVAPTTVELTTTHPNGPDCDGDAIQGFFEVTADRRLVTIQ